MSPLTAARWPAAAVAAAVLAVPAPACAAGGASEPAGPGPAGDTATTHPPASHAAARRAVEGVLADATAVADRLFRDPSAIDDPANRDLARLRQLYVEGSPVPDGIEAQLRELAALGRRYRAAASGVYREVAIFDWDPPVDDDTLRFRTCSLIDTEVVDGTGRVVDRFAEIILTAAEARRIDGVWRFGGFVDERSQRVEIAPGTARPGYCRSVTPADAELPAGFGGEG